MTDRGHVRINEPPDGPPPPAPMPPPSAVADHELANAIRTLRETHYRYCSPDHDWPDACPVFQAWERLR